MGVGCVLVVSVYWLADTSESVEGWNELLETIGDFANAGGITTAQKVRTVLPQK
jgi:hypothetical protein